MDHELLQAIGQVVTREIRNAELFGTGRPPTPLPSDKQAEEGILRSILRGWNCLDDFRPLVASDFFGVLNREVYLAMEALREAGKEVSEVSVGVMLKAGGVALSEETLVEVRWLAISDGDEESVLAKSARVLECSRKRKMIRWLQDIEMQLRTGSESVDSLSSKMRVVLEKRSERKT